MVEAGRIDHAHHEGNAFRALSDAEQFDQAIGAALQKVDLRDTLVIVTADHSHVFNIAGYPLRPLEELPYPAPAFDPDYESLAGNGSGWRRRPDSGAAAQPRATWRRRSSCHNGSRGGRQSRPCRPSCRHARTGCRLCPSSGWSSGRDRTGRADAPRRPSCAPPIGSW
jgi:hypothetical protein